MSLIGAFVIAAICLVRLPLRKVPKIISYCLWAVAGFRLVFPFSIESVFSLMPFNAQIIPQDIALQSIPHIDSGVPVVNDAVSSILPAATPYADANPLQIWIAIGAYLWILGVTVMLLCGVISYLLLKRKMRTAIRIDGNIFETDNIFSPFVLGIIYPKIYLPVSLAASEHDYIILHEQTHIRRHDHIIKFVAYFILCIHWFNPLAWAAFLLMGTDMEMSCDERVLKELGHEIKKDYSRSLLSLATERRIISVSPLAFGEGGIKERVKNVLNLKKPSRIITILAIVFAAALSVGFAVNKVDDVQSPLQVLTGATEEQAELIELHLAECGVSYETIANSVNPITEGMNTNWRAYDLFAEDGSSYVLILGKPDNDFTAVLDYEGGLISGIIDNVITPALYINGEYKFAGVTSLGSIDDEDGTLIDDDVAIHKMGRKAIYMTIDGYNAWVVAGENDADVYDYAEHVTYIPIGKDVDEQMYMRIDDYKAWAAAGEKDADVYDFAVPYDGE